MDLVVRIRNLRAESRIEPGRRIEIEIHPTADGSADLLREERERIAVLVRASDLRIVDSFPEGRVAARGVARGFEIAIPLEGILDIAAERERLEKNLGKIERELAARGKKLASASFVEKAPPHVVEKERALHAELEEKRGRIAQSLQTLAGGSER
jgi:valyl-tRNA synthetase